MPDDPQIKSNSCHCDHARFIRKISTLIMMVEAASPTSLSVLLKSAFFSSSFYICTPEMLLQSSGDILWHGAIPTILPTKTDLL